MYLKLFDNYLCYINLYKQKINVPIHESFNISLISWNGWLFADEINRLFLPLRQLRTFCILGEDEPLSSTLGGGCTRTLRHLVYAAMYFILRLL